jgi:hypothetical protein
LVMPSSQSIVVMIGSVSIMRLQVTLTRALMHSVIHTAFPCDCISSWKWIEMEMDPRSDPIWSLKQSRGRDEVAATPAAASKPCT